MSTEEPSKLASTSVRAGVIASNDASLSVTTPMPVEPMSADASPTAPPSTVGSVLREAREKLGLSPADIANKLRMGLKQVNALEHADYAALPTGTFLRGFVRNYAKAVVLNADEVVLLLEKTHRSATAVSASYEVVPNQQNIKVPALGGELATPKWRFIGIGMVVLLLVAAGWYWWEYVLPHRSEGGRAPANVTSTPLIVMPPAAPVARDVSTAPPDAATAGSATPVSDPPVTESTPPAVAATAAPVTESLPRSAPQNSPTVAVTPRVKEDDRETTAARERAAATTAAGGAALGFTFSGESWVEVMDASGKKVLSRRFKAGDAEEVLGRAPFTVTIGNASSTRMAFNGREFALDPHTRGAVARVVVK